MELPNFVNTWSVYFKSELDLLDFSEWLVRENEKGNVYSSINCAKGRYLSDMLNSKGGCQIQSLSGTYPDFSAELTLAYLDLTVRGKSDLADRVISGQRLHIDLHSKYVEATKCYG